VIAFDRSPDRCAVLRQTILRAHAGGAAAALSLSVWLSVCGWVLMLWRAGTIEARCEDFLRVVPSQPPFASVCPSVPLPFGMRSFLMSRMRQVTHILVDPSCSGSGIVGRAQHTGPSGCYA
jgi:hypothetical protein